ncbi:MAG TPA: HdeD family acid-resistance protein [Streptosporangiaceae bacterium]|nr:HdeD family acid-resistance protein [Streptosporangiaceae bacterium]
MTDPQSGPPAGSGPGGQPSDMPAGSGADLGATGERGQESTRGASSTATARRTSAEASVPQQLGHQQERMAGQAEMYGEEGAAGAAPVPATVAAAAKGSWGVVLLCGLGLIALGIALLVWPSASLTVVAVLIGAAILVAGLVKLWEGFTAKAESGGMRAAYMVIGLLAVFVGIYFLRHHALSLFLLAFVTGVFFIAHGVSDVGLAISAGVPNRGLRAVLGLFSLAAGLVMVIWPGITLALLLTIVAAWLLFYGVVLAMLAFSIRRAGKAAEKMSMPAQRLAASG